jgi:octaprenyl-diphosphate synthase
MPLAILEASSRANDHVGLADRLAALRLGLELDEMLALPRSGDPACVAHHAARHFLARRGKALRPLCVALAAGFGPAAPEKVRALAAAVELAHSATLLHDDVIDDAELRRGAPAARMIFGNSASILAGDWLLVEALRQVRAARLEGLTDLFLETLDQMIVAEALQLERRGRVEPDPTAYLRIVEGKTAALFRWALTAGARAAGLGADEVGAFDRIGRDVGVAFQVVDDILDFEGDAAATGKALLADLREGKITYPLCLALTREPGLKARVVAQLGGETSDSAAIAERVSRTGAIAEAWTFARQRLASAQASVATLTPGTPRDTLAAVVETLAIRRA